MIISINGKPIDITLDTEKNLGDVLQGIDMWISPAGNRIRGICVDGQSLQDDTLSGAFPRDVRDIKELDIAVSPWSELAAEALETLLNTCEFYMNAQFDERTQIALDWENSAAARFLASEIPDMYDLAGRTLSGEGLSAPDLAILIAERLREVSEPKQEICAAGNLITNIAERMEDLPLDIQTGKDQRAAETIQLFARTTEKLFRIFFLLKSEWLSLDTLIIDNLPAKTFIEEFNSALKELSSAYENRDTVLTGDIAEYELAPRMVKFYTAIKEIAR